MKPTPEALSILEATQEIITPSMLERMIRDATLPEVKHRFRNLIRKSVESINSEYLSTIVQSILINLDTLPALEPIHGSNPQELGPQLAKISENLALLQIRSDEVMHYAIIINHASTFLTSLKRSIISAIEDEYTLIQSFKHLSERTRLAKTIVAELDPSLSRLSQLSQDLQTLSDKISQTKTLLFRADSAIRLILSSKDPYIPKPRPPISDPQSQAVDISLNQ